MKKPLTVFMWGYWGWGNHTRQLVRAVDAVEEARGFKPPVFIDIRIRRQVRAKGFMGDAFESVADIRRYKWMQDLVNESILTGDKQICIRRPSAASELLDEAVKLAKEKRRLIFFCSCEIPCMCHRNTVTKLVLQYAHERRLSVQVVEWPGGIPESIDVCVSDGDFRQLERNNRKSIPLADAKPLSEFAGLPLGSIARVHTPSNYDGLFIPTGPAKCWNDQDWYLPVIGKTYATNHCLVKLERKLDTFRKRYGFEPMKHR